MSWKSWSVLILVTILIVALVTTFRSPVRNIPEKLTNATAERSDWQPPDTLSIPHSENGELILYGRELIMNTAKYLGLKGSVAKISNGMNCQNCHLQAGAQLFSNPFSAVASTYPKFRDRSGRIESIEYRINECMERSLNGKKMDSLSREMVAMVA